MDAPPPAPPNALPSSVMLLSLWGPPGVPWRARLMDADAHVHEFDSPFELARFVAQPACASQAADALPTRGLR